MTPQSLFNADNRAVSPASAVMLLAVISVMLTATIGGVVLGAGGQFGAEPPTAQLTADVDPNADAVAITHASGDPVVASEFEIVAYADGAVVDRTAVGGERLSTDESVTVEYATSGTETVDELRVVHTPSDSVVATTGLAEPVRNFDGWA